MSESGSFAGGIDSWIAQEFRRAGFSTDEVWPRATRPRILPRDIAVLLQKLPAQHRADLTKRLENLLAVAPVDARVFGDSNGYTATAILLVDWDTTTDQTPTVRILPDLVPDDVQPAQFFTTLIDRLLAVTPVTSRVTVRERREHREIPVREADSG